MSAAANSILPASVEAERAILGAILLDNAKYQEAIRPDYFSRDSNRRIYAAIAKLLDSGVQADIITLSEELRQQQQLENIGGVAYLAGLTDGVAVRTSILHYVNIVRDKYVSRQIIEKAELLKLRAYEQTEPVADIIGTAEQDFSRLAEAGSASRIKNFYDIPDIFTLPVQPVEWIVPGIFPLHSLVVLAGQQGLGKSYLAQRLAVSCAIGGSFLGRDCQKLPVLYLDRENTQAVSRSRLDIMAGGPVPELRVWGGWVEEPVPDIHAAGLQRIAKELRPLIVIDSLVRFCGEADENAASEMRIIMGQLRRLVDLGATVLVLHHADKVRGAYRGSSDIAAAPDMMYSLYLDEGLMTLTTNPNRGGKTRFGPDVTITIQPDFEHGSFEQVDSPAQVERRDDVAALADAIAGNPGSSQAAIIAAAHIRKERASALLRQHEGKFWRSERTDSGRIKYFPMTCSHAGTVPELRTHLPVPVFPPFKGNTEREQVSGTARLGQHRNIEAEIPAADFKSTAAGMEL